MTSLVTRGIARCLDQTATAMLSAAVPLAFLLSSAVTACDPSPPHPRTPILLFAGKGTSTGDIAAVERILEDNHLQYAKTTSRQLNGMSVSELMTCSTVPSTARPPARARS